MGPMPLFRQSSAALGKSPCQNGACTNSGRCARGANHTYDDRPAHLANSAVGRFFSLELFPIVGIRSLLFDNKLFNSRQWGPRASEFVANLGANRSYYGCVDVRSIRWYQHRRSGQLVSAFRSLFKHMDDKNFREGVRCLG
jgi:hypothetical protein